VLLERAHDVLGRSFARTGSSSIKCCSVFKQLKMMRTRRSAVSATLLPKWASTASPASVRKTSLVATMRASRRLRQTTAPP